MSTTVSDHPETALLQNYLNNIAAAEYSELRLHLIRCAHCRAVVDGLSGLQAISQQPQDTNETLTEHQQQQIADFIDGNVRAADQQPISDFIQSSAAAMKAALHYASHKSAMDKAAIKPVLAARQASTLSAKHNAPLNAWLNKLKSLISIQTPVWFSVPATAAIVALISINLLHQPVPDNNVYAIANYQDNAIIQFRTKSALPGIGFFARSGQVSEPYADVSVAVTENKQIKIQWPPVSGALNYTLRLQMFHQGNKTVLGEVTTTDTSAAISTGLDNIFHRYEWVLSGDTQDNRVFVSSGGFVISKPDTGISR
jgi:hypothetical protein